MALVSGRTATSRRQCFHYRGGRSRSRGSPGKLSAQSRNVLFPQSSNVLIGPICELPLSLMGEHVQSGAELSRARAYCAGEREPSTASTVLDTGHRGKAGFPPAFRSFQNRTFLLCCDRKPRKARRAGRRRGPHSTPSPFANPRVPKSHTSIAMSI
jgi:hypothetical protein